LGSVASQLALVPAYAVRALSHCELWAQPLAPLRTARERQDLARTPHATTPYIPDKPGCTVIHRCRSCLESRVGLRRRRKWNRGKYDRPEAILVLTCTDTLPFELPQKMYVNDHDKFQDRTMTARRGRGRRGHKQAVSWGPMRPTFSCCPCSRQPAAVLGHFLPRITLVVVRHA
jgi:hypothetical protein